MTPFLEVFVSMSLSTFISIPSLKRYFLFPTTTGGTMTRFLSAALFLTWSALPAVAQPIATTDQAEVCRVEMGTNPRDGTYGRLTYSVRGALR